MDPAHWQNITGDVGACASLGGIVTRIGSFRRARRRCSHRRPPPLASRHHRARRRHLPGASAPALTKAAFERPIRQRALSSSTTSSPPRSARPTPRPSPPPRPSSIQRRGRHARYALAATCRSSFAGWHYHAVLYCSWARAGLPAALLLACVPVIPVSIMMVMRNAKRSVPSTGAAMSIWAACSWRPCEGLTTLKVYQADRSWHERINAESSVSAQRPCACW